MSGGYTECYAVTATNYKSIEEELNTDLSKLGIQEGPLESNRQSQISTIEKERRQITSMRNQEIHSKGGVKRLKTKMTVTTASPRKCS